MRPPGEIATAVLAAAERLARDEGGERHGPTLRELAHQAKVSVLDARRTVDNLRRAGKLEPVAERKVDYRNRPVIEYAPKRRRQPPDEQAVVDVGSVFAIWVQD